MVRTKDVLELIFAILVFVRDQDLSREMVIKKRKTKLP